VYSFGLRIPKIDGWTLSKGDEISDAEVRATELRTGDRAPVPSNKVALPSLYVQTYALLILGRGCGSVQEGVIVIDRHDVRKMYWEKPARVSGLKPVLVLTDGGVCGAAAPNILGALRRVKRSADTRILGVEGLLS
jgi:hypothetical protein